MKQYLQKVIVLILLAGLCNAYAFAANEENLPAIVGNADVLNSHDAHFHDADCGHKRRYHGGRWNYFYNGFWEYYDGNRGIWYYYPRAQAHAAEDYGRHYSDPTTGMEFIFVKGGCYQMGDTFGDGYSNEKPVHEVCVDNFYMGKYEVTQKEWNAVMRNNPSYFKNCDDCPVEQVSWSDAQEFINKLSQKTGKKYRLPTEAEWEYAARSGGKSEKYAGRDEVDSVAWYKGNSGSKTHPVGQKQPNGLGIYDMSGNVWEWVQDWYDVNYYKNSPKDNPKGAGSGSRRVYRGGSWYLYAEASRAGNRLYGVPDLRYADRGFRLVQNKN